MKRLFAISIFLVIVKLGFSQNVLTGKVTAKDNSLLEGATVYIDDLKTGALAHADGIYTINNLPAGNFVVEVRFIGYATQAQLVSIKGSTTQDFVLIPSAIQTPDVVVTGTSKAIALTQNPQPTSEISNQYLWEHSATNVIDALALAPGVSAMTDGQSISKPVIRGLGWNRVLTVNDGVIQVDQVWFDEFGIEADPDAVDRAEILKGPASLAYGSDAIAGVINLIPEEALPEGEIKGDLRSNYQSNNGLVGNMFRIAGTNNGISWSGRIDYTLAHAYQNAYDGYVLNSQFNNLNVDGTLGIHRKWGYSQVHASYFELQTGVVDGTRDANGTLAQAQAYPDVKGDSVFYESPTKQQLKSYTPLVINQRIRHTKVVWDNSIAVGQGRITGLFSFQRNQRQETNDPIMPNTPDIYYYSQAATYDLRYVSQNWKGFDFSVGVNGLYQASKSLGTLMLIPDYNIFQIGGFFIGNYRYKGLTLSGGIRFDDRIFTGKDHWVDSTSQEPVASTDSAAYHEFTGFKSNFSGVSGSIGATYDFKHDVYIKGNFSTGFRAPNVAECAANGVHDGTPIWEIGDPNLKPEMSLEGDLAVGMNGKDVNFEVDGFINSIQHFIYAHGLKSVYGPTIGNNFTGDSVNNTLLPFPQSPVYKDTQGVALMGGVEVSLDIHPAAAQWFGFNTTFGMVTGGLRNVADSVKVLPFVPPARLTADLRINLNKIGKNNPMSKVIRNSYIRFGVQYCFEQKKLYAQSAIYSGLDPVGTPFEYAASRTATPGYVLLNLGAGGDIVNHNGRTVLKLSFIVNNLANTTYMDYMSRFKYLPVNPVTNRVGVFNMGRNISIKLDIPIDFKKG